MKPLPPARSGPGPGRFIGPLHKGVREANGAHGVGTRRREAWLSQPQIASSDGVVTHCQTQVSQWEAR